MGDLNSCISKLRGLTDFVPKVGLVLGSGLGGFADSVDTVCTVDYSELPGFPVSTAPGHKGRFVFCHISGVPTVIMQGRVHYYEGYPIEDVVLPIRLMRLMGAEILFLTNASGGIDPGFRAGDLMLITDHISLFAPNPLVGPNKDEFGVRFPDMTHIYDPKLQEIIRRAARDAGTDLKEGVYVQLTGPSYESPAEIRMLRTLGANAVGMSTACEAIAANHAGMRVCAVSCISNMAAGMNKEPLTHAEVQEAADKAAPLFRDLLVNSIRLMG